MASVIDYATQGTRIFLTSLKSRCSSQHYAGNAQEICQQIVKDCWNGRFFQTSTTNFPQFWTRDFGWCTSSLMKLGYEQEVHHTLRYALHRFQEANKVTTTITPKGRPFDFPTMAVDSLPWLIHSIKVSKFGYYPYKDFLNRQIQRFNEKVINPQTGLVRPDIYFSSIKDLSLRKSSCYDNGMVAMLAQDLNGLNLENPFRQFNYPKLLRQHFWNGKYFYDDLSKRDYVAGDANLFPFLLGIIKDEEMLRMAVQQIRAAGLDQPFPLKYTANRKNIKFVWQELFVRNYESDSIWTHLGPLYIKVVQQIDKELAAEYKKKYTEQIEKHGNYLEVFFPDGKLFRSPFYYCDQGLLWASNYLTL